MNTVILGCQKIKVIIKSNKSNPQVIKDKQNLKK